MAGRRLLDAAKLFNAGTAIAKQHLGLRREQWDVYSRTSTLAKSVKNQTDRVTVTFAAATELAKRFNDTRPVWQEESSASDAQSRATSTTHSQEKAQPDHGRPLPEHIADPSPDPVPNANHDTFAARSRIPAHNESSLPSTTIPDHADLSTGPDTHEKNSQASIDQDVFPSPVANGYTSSANPQSGEEFDLSSLPTTSVIGLGGGRGRLGLNQPYGSRQKLAPKPLPEMVEASKRWEREREALASQDTKREPMQEERAVVDQADIHELASSLAGDVKLEVPESEPQEKAVYEMRESRVPSSRLGRLWQYSGLATSMAFGAVGEGLRRISGGTGQGSLMLSESNINRLVAKLSRMRGAALKLGQMISFQDSKVLPATINTVLQRVQDSADYMPASQRDKVLIRNLGDGWRDLFSAFEEKPFAAASIGQVHKATLKSNGKAVAVKIQYPGVRNSIDSDLNNLSLLLTASQLLPRGLFLDKTIANARTELGWECDYQREAEACIRFKELLAEEDDIFTVPTIYLEACGPDVLTAEFMGGQGVTKIKDLSQDERNWIGSNILRLCLRELMEWRFMQTDPNWTNFLYNRSSTNLELLDFGASRDFPDEFVEPYVALLIAASKGDRDACRDYSIQLGYLTGQESKEMLNAHVDSILTLAEPFMYNAPKTYDFEDQTITDRVRANIGLMLRERLAPPPEETYSLHRKLSGAFLLCARLRSKVDARDMFASAVRVWEGREQKVKA